MSEIIKEDIVKSIRRESQISIKNEILKMVGNAFFSLVSLITNLAIPNAPFLVIHLLELYSYAQHLGETYPGWMPPSS